MLSAPHQHKRKQDCEFIRMNLEACCESLVNVFGANGVGGCGATCKIKPERDFESDNATRTNVLAPNEHPINFKRRTTGSGLDFHCDGEIVLWIADRCGQVVLGNMEPVPRQMRNTHLGSLFGSPKPGPAVESHAPPEIGEPSHDGKFLVVGRVTPQGVTDPAVVTKLIEACNQPQLHIAFSCSVLLLPVPLSCHFPWRLLSHHLLHCSCCRRVLHQHRQLLAGACDHKRKSALQPPGQGFQPCALSPPPLGVLPK